MAQKKINIIDNIGLPNELLDLPILHKSRLFSIIKPEYGTQEELRKILDTGQSRHLIILNVGDFARAKKVFSKITSSTVAFALVGTSDEIHQIKDCAKLLEDSGVIDIIETPLSGIQFSVLLRRSQAHFKQQASLDVLHHELVQQRDELKKLNEIGIALSSENDIATLLDSILTISMDITTADAGSLYIVEEIPDMPFDKFDFFKNKQLRFKHSKNHSRQVPFTEFTMPISPNSIAGYAALSQKPLNIPDVYHIPEDVPYGFGGLKFDESINYRTMSMLTVPMLNRDKETIGVIQLINKKRSDSLTLETTLQTEHDVITFNKGDEDFIYSMASQAAVSYENQQLYDSIKNLFEGFIKASVTAIESRDPTTSGHSERVAILTVGLAETVDHLKTGPYKDVHFSRQDIQEINYASLLHDFGKIGVREPVLVKAKKLYEHEKQAIENRYDIIKKALEVDISKKKIQYLLSKSRDEALADIHKLDEQFTEQLAEIDDFLSFILKVNEPTILKTEGFERLKEIQSKHLFVNDHEIYPYLTDSEAKRLMIPKGSLDEEERQQIESHVTHTYKFLQQIPWTNDLRNVPEIAYAHHEKMDGSGYPLKIPDKAIPFQSRMMTISDIYDALTAQDRPYKRAVPRQKALDILGFEVKDHKIDQELYNIFLEAKIYERVKTD
jgi:HD-GYP domain-containing protein (c-di-GMP phosphodiesterase class II)